ncbi:MAG: PASTA domain-containing protein [Alkalilacustris sp.]
MARNIRDLVRDVVASPLGDVIASVGQGVAAAQQALDEASLAKTLEIYAEGDEGMLRLLREIGYRPTFYALPETTGEVRVALSLSTQTEGTPVPRSLPAGVTTAMSAGGAAAPGPATAVRVDLARAGTAAAVPTRVYATPVDAGYAGRYGYRADIAAKLTFRIVPVPAPDGADELRLVPDLADRSVALAREALAGLGLGAAVEAADGTAVEPAPEAATVAAQRPAPGTILRLGDTVTLVVGSPA